jgi:hypothetical protein
MLVDIGEVKKHIKPKADSTLHNMRKDKLFEYIRTLEHNYNVAVSFNENQARYIESLGVLPNWIPVNERLPEESGQYIVCCDDSGCPCGEGIWYQSGVVVCAGVDVGVHGGICWEWQEGSTLYDLEGIVTHWMPLPEPPKEVAE